MKNFNRGFTLLELLIVIAIVGILGTVAIPYYNSYVIRARLAEVEHAMAVVKSAVSTYRQENNAWPICPDINAIQNILGIGVGAVSRIRQTRRLTGLRIDANGRIIATVDNVHSTVDRKWMRLTPTENADRSLDWKWEYQGDFPEKFRNRNRD
jgi:prepilin-type N-terminal cleavage/methylation domain-containing protein